MADKRRHTRVVHRDVIRFDAAGTTIEGFSVDISRTGIQVEVAVPHSFDKVEMIRFALPDGEPELEIPVRVARRSAGADGRGQYTLAFEFLRSADREMRLIENYIRELKERDRDGNDRRIPRIDCSVPVRCGPVTDATIRDISPEGILVSAAGTYQRDVSEETVSVGTDLPVEFSLPGDDRPIRGVCRVAYVISGGAEGTETEGTIRFGAPFRELSTVYRARIHSFIERNAATRSLRSAWSQLDSSSDEEYPTDEGELRRVLRDTPGAVFHILAEKDLTIYSGFREDRDGQDIPIRCTPTVSREIVPGDDLFVSFTAEGSNYYFSTHLRSRRDSADAGGTILTVAPPHRIHRSDNRSNRRTPVHRNDGISLWIHDKPDTAATGRLLDVSRRGFLCEITGTDEEMGVFREGTSVEYLTEGHTEGQTGLFPQGRIRHVAEKASEYSPSPGDPSRGDHRRVLHVGVETGVRHGQLQKTVITTPQWEERVQHIRDDASEDTAIPEARRITYRNSRGQELVALENRVGMEPGGTAKPTVVIIPPAFGKKKENPAPLALSICETFRRGEAPVVVIRFDGINRPGESHNDGENPLRGYEMLHYRPSQGVDDIRATLDYLFGTADFTPERVILVTSSMSSVDARKLLVKEKRIDGWVSLMGVPAARTTLMNVLAGTDIIGNYRLNIPNGIRGMLGHLVDMDSLAHDLVEEGYAFLTDARYDMARITIPVLWIPGEHDHWVDEAEVEDIMSIEAGAPREIIRIPTGHNLRNSDDAAEAFRIISLYCADLAELNVAARAPSRDAVLKVLAREREGVYRPIDSETVTAYWHSYLLGTEGESEGYDFYGNLAEFREFISREVALLAPRQGQTIADMGCGTGLLTAALLNSVIGDTNGDGNGDRNGESDGSGTPTSTAATKIVATDLIPEALQRTREKCRALLEGCDYDGTDVLRRGNLSLHFVAANLEPDRTRPLLDFVVHPQIPITFLKGRMEGLPDSVVETWQKEYPSRMAAFLRGEDVSLSENVPEADRAREIHRAARHILDRAVADVPGSVPGSVPDSDVSPGYDAIAASLFISYILNPDYLLYRFHRMLKPGGTILVSSMRPDSDVSKIFTGYIDEVEAGIADSSHRAAAKAMLNEAAGLFELEEEGYFRFYTEKELDTLLRDAGFRNVRVERSLGNPAQAYIATGIAVENPPEPWRKYV